jgi:hypothetical protein
MSQRGRSDDSDIIDIVDVSLPSVSPSRNNSGSPLSPAIVGAVYPILVIESNELVRSQLECVLYRLSATHRCSFVPTFTKSFMHAIHVVKNVNFACIILGNPLHESSSNESENDKKIVSMPQTPYSLTPPSSPPTLTKSLKKEDDVAAVSPSAALNHSSSLLSRKLHQLYNDDNNESPLPRVILLLSPSSTSLLASDSMLSAGVYESVLQPFTYRSLSDTIMHAVFKSASKVVSPVVRRKSMTEPKTDRVYNTAISTDPVMINDDMCDYDHEFKQSPNMVTMMRDISPVVASLSLSKQTPTSEKMKTRTLSGATKKSKGSMLVAEDNVNFLSLTSVN